jgi:hypothetical protein
VPGRSLVLGGHDFERFHVQRPYFVVAMESALSQDAIEEKLERSAENNPSFPHGLLDAIIVVSSGDNLIYVSPGPSKYMALNEEKEFVHGWVTFGKGNALFRWLHWLHVVIPYDVPTASILEWYLRAESNEEK